MSSYCRVEIREVMLKAPILWYRTPPGDSAEFNKLDQVSKALVLIKDNLLVPTDLGLVSPTMLKVTCVPDGIVLDIKCFIHMLRVCGELRHGGWIYATLNLGIGINGQNKVVHYPERIGLMYSTSELLPSDCSTVALEAHLKKEFNLPELAEDIVQFDRRPPTRFERAWVI